MKNTNYTEKDATSTAPFTSHLDFDEVLDFVSVKTLDEETKKLISKVTRHCVECDECSRLVDAVETIHKEFVRLGNNKEPFSQRPPVMDEELKKMIEEVRALKKEQRSES